MKIAKAMKLDVVTVLPDLAVAAAHRIMLEGGLRHLPVVSGTKLAGIVSDRDLLLVIGKDRDGAFLYPSTTVGEIMSLSPVSAGPGVPTPELAQVMLDRKVDALPIVAADGTLLGLVTSTDLMRIVSQLPRGAPPALDYQVRRAFDPDARA